MYHTEHLIPTFNGNKRNTKEIECVRWSAHCLGSCEIVHIRHAATIFYEHTVKWHLKSSYILAKAVRIYIATLSLSVHLYLIDKMQQERPHMRIDIRLFCGESSINRNNGVTE